MERMLLDVPFWDITQLKPESYIHFWRLITTEQFHFDEEHVNIASALANIFIGQELYRLFEEFLQEFDSEKLRLLKNDEQFLRALIKLKMHKNSFSEVCSLIQEGKFTNPESIIEVWDEAHYRQRSLTQAHPLTAVEKFRIRKKNPPPHNICPEGRRPKTIPDAASKVLKEWFLSHIDDPYPSKLKKHKLAEESGLTLTQVKSWFANARRKQKKKLLKKTKETKTKAKPKSTNVSHIRKWKLNKLPLTIDLTETHSCVAKKDTKVRNETLHVNLENHGQILEPVISAKFEKQNIATETNSKIIQLTEKDSQSVSGGKRLDFEENKPETFEKKNSKAVGRHTNFLKTAENDNHESGLDSTEDNIVRICEESYILREKQGKQDSGDKRADHENVTETKEKTTHVSILNKIIQKRLKDKLEQNENTSQTEDVGYIDVVNKNEAIFLNTESPGNSPDIGFESLAALTELCNKITSDTYTFIPDNSAAEPRTIYNKDKVKCRKLNKLEKLRRTWNESFVSQYKKSDSFGDYKSTCSSKHCISNCRTFQSASGKSGEMNQNHRNYAVATFPDDSIVKAQTNGYQGYQMMSPKIADEAENQRHQTGPISDGYNWMANEGFYQQGKDPLYQQNLSWMAVDNNSGPWNNTAQSQQGYHGYGQESQSYGDRSQLTYQQQSMYPSNRHLYEADPVTGFDQLCYQDYPLNFSISSVQDRDSVDDAVEGLLTLSSSQESEL